MYDFSGFKAFFPGAGTLFPGELRDVTEGEIKGLLSRGCHSGNWKGVKVTGSTRMELIRNCRFNGDVSIHLPGGELSGTVFTNCRVIGPVTVVSTGLVSGYTLFPGARVEFCGSVEWNGFPGFLQASIQGGLETGERAIPILGNMTHADAAFLASAPGRGHVPELRELLEGMKESLFGSIGENSLIRCCPVIENSVFLTDSSVNGACAVRGSMLFPGSSASDGSLVRNSVLQWNAAADSMAAVQDSIVGECSLVEKHGKLTSSFLGADSVLGQGEITASVVGPLTGMHHQSLLIAALWPGGRGNIGYGANIGSNHTSRLPDQEIRPGTGFFFGLGTSVKFPSDFSRSPYSVIATGMTTLPQRVEYPFSLITLPMARPEGVPEGWCRLVPGWMLHSNLYSLLRNLWKYRNRTRSVITPVETGVFTPLVLEAVSDALKRLEACTGITPEGAGKNFVTEEDRLAGISAYRKCLRTFRLLEMYRSGSMNPGEAGELLDLIAQIREGSRRSREKDMTRGLRIIEDYGSIRQSPEEDPFLDTLSKAAEPVEISLKGILARG